MNNSKHHGTIDGLSVEGELQSIRPQIGMFSYAGTVRMSSKDADELTRRHVTDPDRSLMYEGPAFDQGERIRLTIRVSARIVSRDKRSATLSVQSNGGPVSE